MRTLTRAGIVLAVLAATAAGAAAQGVQRYGERAGWQIAINDNMGPGCLISKDFGALQIQFGIDARPGDPSGYMAAVLKPDSRLAAGEAIPVKFQVGGQTFTGQAIGENIGGAHVAIVPVENAMFVYDIAKKETLTVEVAGASPTEISLAGTFEAMKEMRACQESR